MAQLNADATVNGILAEPTPVCLFMAFGDSAVELELRFWINDPQHGIANVKSAVLLALWDAFRAHGIEIPYPQRDLHIHPVPTHKRAGQPFIPEA